MLGRETYELIAKVGMDTKDFDKNSNGMVGKFKNMKSKLVGIAGTLMLGKLIGDSLTEGGKLQQSLGGVETLFGKSADIVKQNASNAFKTAGMSANQYMETSTSFAASLVNSLAGNTEKAAKMADVAISDMSDNANKMGSDLGSIEHAYQGFAKQNYTMLDNLKLGYGGTRSEMQRLLDDANKYNAAQGKHTNYQMDNYADIVSAIHDVQVEMDIYGTTAKEAAKTLEGSTNMMKASWKNLLGAMSTGQDLSKPIQDLASSVVTFAKNVVPMILNIIKALPPAIIGVIKEGLPGMLQAGSEMMSKFATGFGGDGGLSKMLKSVNDVIMSIDEYLMDNADIFLSKGIEIITQIANGLLQGLPNLITQVTNIPQSIISTLATLLPMLVEAGGQLIENLVTGLKTNLPMIVESAKEAITNFLYTITDNIPMILQSGLQLVVYIIQGISQALPMLFQAGFDIVSHLVDTLIELGPSFLQSGLDIISGINTGMGEGGESLKESFRTLLTNTLNIITEKIPELLVKGIEIISNIVGGILQAMPTLISTAGQIVSTVLTGIIESLPKLATSGFNILMSVINGIMDNLPKLWEVAKSLVGTIATTIETNLPKLLSAGLQMVSNILTGVKENAPKLLGKMLDLVTKILGDIAKNLPQFIQRGAEMIVKMIRGIGEKAPEIISKIAETIVKLANKIREKLPMLLQKGKEIIINMIDGIIQNGPKILSQMATTVGNIALEIGKNLPKILAAGVKLILELLKGIVDTVPDIIAKIPELIGFMKDAFLKGVGSFFSIGANLIKGLWEGIGSVKKWIGNKLKGFASGITNRVKNFFGVNSPSRLFRDEIGAMLGKGLAIGVEREEGTVNKAMNVLEKATLRDMSSNIGFNLETNSNQLKGVENMNGILNSSLAHTISFNDANLNLNQQPAYINFALGNQHYEGFVNDIFDTEEKNTNLEIAYMGG